MIHVLIDFWKKQWVVVLLFLFSAFFLSYNLSGQGLSLDEPQTMLIARGIQHFGFPSAWDGKNLISDANGKDSLQIGESYLWTWHPPLQTYVTYLFTTLFGDTIFVARFPFVLFGAGTIVLLYLLSKEMFANRFVAILVSLQLVSLLPFFLYVRQARYYSPSMFFSLILFWLFVRYGKKRWGRESWIIFFFTTLFLGLTNYFVFGTCVICFGILALWYKDKRMLLFLGGLGIVGILFLYLVHPFGGSLLNTQSNKPYVSTVFTNLSYINGWIFSFVLLPFVWLGLRKKRPLLFLVALWIGIKLVLYSFVEPHGRFLVDLFPIFIFLYGFLYEWLGGKVGLGMVFVIFSLTVLTNIFNVLPYKLFGQQKQLLFMPTVYKSELVGEYPNVTQSVATFLSTHTQRRSLVWSNNYRWSLVYYGNHASVSPVCNHTTEKFEGPKVVSDPTKISAFIFFQDDTRLPKALDAVPCLGKKWQEKIEKDFKKVILSPKSIYAVNDVDMVNRQFPPPLVKEGIVVYLKKDGN